MAGNEMYELLKRKDAELVAYRALVEALRARFAQAASEEAASSAWKDAYQELGSLFYEHGFKSDGRLRGIE